MNTQTARIIAGLLLLLGALGAKAQPILWSQDQPGGLDGRNLSAPAGGRIATLVALTGDAGAELALRNAATGTALWTQPVDTTAGFGSIRGVVITGSGDVVTATTTSPYLGSSSIAKYSAADGALAWESTFSNPDAFGSGASAVLVDTFGHVAAGGSTCMSSFYFIACPTEGWVERHDGATGAVLWHRRHGIASQGEGAGGDPVADVAVDSAGNVFVIGSRTVAKYAAATGDELWSTPADAVYGAAAIVVTATGDAISVYRENSGHRITRRSGATGAIAWSQSYSSGTASEFLFTGGPVVALMAGGDLVVSTRGITRRISGVDGAVVWSRTLPGAAMDLAVDTDGHVIMGRALLEGAGRAFVTKLRGSSGQLLSNIPVAGLPFAVAADETGIYTTTSIGGTLVRTLKLLPKAPPPADFDADGKGDIVWRHQDGRVAVWLMSGLAPTATREIDTFGSPVTHVNDVNGDGKADLFVENAAGGITAFVMDGTLSSAVFLMGNGSGWHLAATGDLDGDGIADLALQHNDGRVLAWANLPGGYAGQATILGPGTGWVVSRLADFNADGKDDILFRHPDGRHAIWLMDGTTPTSQVQILNAGGWTATHTPDLNGDGKADILWQQTDGTVAAWIMNGTSMASGATLLAPGSGWTVTHTADFDGDGKDDLYFTHTDGRAAIYLMNGLVPMQTTQILNAGSGWSAKVLRDLNGDGKADIVWEHTDGRVAVWLMNGTAMVNGSEILGPGTGWSVSTAGQ